MLWFNNKWLTCKYRHNNLSDYRTTSKLENKSRHDVNFSSLMVLEVVVVITVGTANDDNVMTTTTSGTIGDDEVGIMSTLGFQCNKNRDKQRVLMHGHQGWNVRHGLCHIYMIYGYIWVVYSFCLFCCLFIIVTTQFVALYKPCKPKPKPPTFDNIVLTIYPQYWYWKTHKDIL